MITSRDIKDEYKSENLEDQSPQSDREAVLYYLKKILAHELNSLKHNPDQTRQAKIQKNIDLIQQLIMLPAMLDVLTSNDNLEDVLKQLQGIQDATNTLTKAAKGMPLIKTLRKFQIDLTTLQNYKI